MTQNVDYTGDILADSATTAGEAVSTGTATALLLFCQNTLAEMLPLLIIAATIIVLDLIFGIKASKKRGDPIRISRAIRRTLGKMVEYFCWCLLASSIGVALRLPALETVIILVVIGIEIISIVQNWYFAKYGKKVKINAAKIAAKTIEAKTGIIGLDEAITVNDNESKKESHNGEN